MKRFIVSITCVLLVASSLAFGFDLFSSDGAYEAIQTWHTLATYHRMLPDTARYITLSVFYSSKRFNVPVEDILGIMAVESSFIPTTQNGSCTGLMQITPKIANLVIKYWNLPKGNPSEIWYNVLYGTAYFAYLNQRRDLRINTTEYYYYGISTGTPTVKALQHYKLTDKAIKYYKLVGKAIDTMRAW